jgi:DNA-binding NarL/FixJ family response regulator
MTVPHTPDESALNTTDASAERNSLANIRVVVADDHAEVRDALVKLLSRTTTVVGVASNGQEAIEMVRATEPDAVIMDLRMPVMDGVAATVTITTEHPEVVVIAHGAWRDRELAAEAIAAGAREFVPKGGSLEQALRRWVSTK